MLSLVIPETEYYDDISNSFVKINETKLTLEHSLVSVSKWEAKWKKPFLSKDKKSEEEFLDYIRFMTLTQNVSPNVYFGLTRDHYQKINDYIQDPMTATTFSDKDNGKRNNKIITSELIYYQMIAFQIPVEFQKWHLNRLLTLIHVCNIKNAPPKKMKKGEVMKQNAALNAARRAKMGSKG